MPASEPEPTAPTALFEQAVAGNRRAAARLLSVIERGGEPAREVGRLAFGPSAAVESVVGVTGAPGAGKSTLTARLVAEARAAGGAVAVLAVDPTSPLSGGALLGDRVRMQEHSTDAGVFVRSMASRGHVGGLALAVPEAIRLLVAVGYPTVLVETVGVGQVEVEVAGQADTTVVVVTPGWGDEVQAAKAGLLEVADVFVVNKADRGGAEETRRELAAMLDTDPAMGAWRPPILLTTATEPGGASELWGAVRDHGAYLRRSGELERRRRRRLQAELDQVILRRLTAGVRAIDGGRAYESAVEDVASHRVDPYAAADELLGKGGP